jgi:hypothetical protein
VVSGVLALLPEPWKTLTELLQSGALYAFFDRTALIDSDRDWLTLQHVPNIFTKAIICPGS